MLAENKNLVTFIIDEVFNRKRTELIQVCYAAGCEVQSPDGPSRGHEALRTFIESYAAGFPDFQLQVNYMMAEEDRVVVHYTFVGTNTGSMAGFPATGKIMRIPGMMVSRIRSGRIAEQHFFWDNLGPRRQTWLASVAERQIRKPAAELWR